MAAFEDSFVDTGNTALSAHAPDVGTAWTLVTGAVEVYKINTGGTLLESINVADNDAYYIDDLGSADQVTIFRVADTPNSSNHRSLYACVRLSDHDNFIGWRWFGTGSAGSRLTKCDAGSFTDLLLVDGAEATIRTGWVKIETEGDTIRLFHGGTGASPTWVEVGSVTETFNNTITRQGLAKNGSTAVLSYIQYFEADVFGGGGAVTVTRTVDVDALLQKQINITNMVDAQLSKTRLTTLDIDAVLSRSIAVLTEIDALLMAAQTAQTNVDGLLQRRQELTTAVNALLNKTQTLVTDVDAVLVAAGITAITTGVDALLQKTRNIVIISDALLRKNLSSQTTIDSILQTRSTITTLINAVVQKTRLLTLSVDGVLFDAEAVGFEGVIGSFNLSQSRVNFAVGRSVSFGASRSFILDNPRGFRRSS